MIKKDNPPGWFEAFLRLSFFPEDTRDERLAVRLRYRDAVLSGDMRRARRILVRECWSCVRCVWVPRITMAFGLYIKFRGN